MRVLFEEFLALPLPILWLLLLALVVWRRRPASRALFAAAALFFALASLPAVGKLLTWGLVSTAPLFETMEAREYAAVVVPTAGTFDDGTGRWWPGKNSVLRAAAGRELQRRLGIPLIVSGGALSPDQPPEAVTTSVRLGLTGEAVWLETAGRDSAESAEKVAALLADQPVRSVLLVTSAAHVARMSAALRHHGLSVVAAPVGLRPEALSSQAWGVTDFIPRNSGLMLTRGALFEYAGIAYYLATGRLRLGDLLPGEE